MTVRIEKDGWSIAGDSLEDLAIGIKAVQLALNGAPTKPPVSTPQVVSRPRILPTRRRHVVVPPPPETTDAHRLSIASKILRAMRDNEPETTTGPLMEAVGTDSGKQFGGMAAATNRVIESVGYKVDDVYTARRLGKKRFWRAGRLIDECINTLDAAIAGNQVPRQVGVTLVGQ